MTPAPNTQTFAPPPVLPLPPCTAAALHVSGLNCLAGLLPAWLIGLPADRCSCMLKLPMLAGAVRAAYDGHDCDKINAMPRRSAL